MQMKVIAQLFPVGAVSFDGHGGLLTSALNLGPGVRCVFLEFLLQCGSEV